MVDVDESEELAEAHGVDAVPHFVLYKDGRVVAQYSGSKAEDLAKLLE